jgi:uncharacterized protein (TIGR00255 family)
MTGFARVQRAVPGLGVASVSLRAVNGRFLDLRLHLSRDLGEFEPRARELVQQYIKRGTIDISVTVQSRLSGHAEWQLNEPAARAWLKAAHKLRLAIGAAEEPTLQDALRVSDLLVAREREPVSSKEMSGLASVLQSGLEKLNRERTREGRATGRLLRDQLVTLKRHVVKIRLRRERLSGEVEARVSARLQEIFGSLRGMGSEEKLDRSRLLHEAAFALDRMDITEELARLNVHIGTVESWLRGSMCEGKKLDFYTQELLREINTIGSKSHDGTITREVVEAKSVIERIREQVQNIE